MCHCFNHNESIWLTLGTESRSQPPPHHPTWVLYGDRGLTASGTDWRYFWIVRSLHSVLRHEGEFCLPSLPHQPPTSGKGQPFGNHQNPCCWSSGGPMMSWPPEPPSVCFLLLWWCALQLSASPSGISSCLYMEIWPLHCQGGGSPYKDVSQGLTHGQSISGSPAPLRRGLGLEWIGQQLLLGHGEVGKDIRQLCGCRLSLGCPLRDTETCKTPSIRLSHRLTKKLWLSICSGLSASPAW